jgi:hypothetical protein
MGNQRTHGFFSFIACACTACGAGNGDGLDSNGRPIGESGSDSESAPLVATFESIQSHVFTPICTACHAGANAPLGLRLDATNSYGLLVGVASAESPGTLRVKPGDPGNSYIIQKLEGHAAVGAQMPLGGPPLPSATIAMIRQWIIDGALKTAQASASSDRAKSDKTQALQVITTSPASAASIDFSPRQVIVNFDGDINASTLDANAIRLIRIPDVADAELIASTVVVNPDNADTLIITPAGALIPGNYRLTITANAGFAIADMQSRTLPQDFTFEFTVAAVQ